MNEIGLKLMILRMKNIRLCVLRMAQERGAYDEA